ncbi:MAG: DUF4430 domain-containing protein [Gaiellales bacterium]
MRRALPALLLAAALAAGCGTSKTQPPSPSAAGARVSVTADWGTARVASGRGNPGTVIDATRAVANVATSYGGRYVSAIDGRAGDGTRDWIFWVNGIEAPVGGADAKVAAGDRLWWDLHRWTGRVHVPAVVADWPMPLSRGLADPTTGVSADPPLSTALRAAGVDVAQPAATHGPRAIVGAGAALMDRDPLWGPAVADPAASGLTAWIDIKGYVRVWNAALGRAQTVPDGVAVIVATTDGYTADDPPVVVVAGVTEADALAAAQLLVQHPELVRDATAVCLDASGAVVCRGGVGRTR